MGDVGLLEADDLEIWTRAVEAGAIFVSKDEDFASRRLMVSEGPQVLWVRLGNTRIAELLSWFEARLPEVEEALSRGEPLVELV